jgi:hypothetical protein
MRQWFLNFSVGLLKKILNTKILLASMNAATSSFKRVTGGIFKISKIFKEASKNLSLDFLSNKN